MPESKTIARTREILREHKIWVDDIELLNYALVYAIGQKDSLIEQAQQLEKIFKENTK